MIYMCIYHNHLSKVEESPFIRKYTHTVDELIDVLIDENIYKLEITLL